jgi:hypothetical protein
LEGTSSSITQACNNDHGVISFSCTDSGDTTDTTRTCRSGPCSEACKRAEDDCYASSDSSSGSGSDSGSSTCPYADLGCYTPVGSTTCPAGCEASNAVTPGSVTVGGVPWGLLCVSPGAGVNIDSDVPQCSASDTALGAPAPARHFLGATVNASDTALGGCYSC